LKKILLKINQKKKKKKLIKKKKRKKKRKKKSLKRLNKNMNLIISKK